MLKEEDVNSVSAGLSAQLGVLGFQLQYRFKERTWIACIVEVAAMHAIHV